ncbi:hypothetical protein PIB30_073805 [Stylosanthes scabra]|uniref:Uncharacterized protein n=1 Tax=Stylosanthes scabra TaxID=79078 RepID=A0ABU6TR09_9FABA|nr:hypothetical protein [Stylosanthes scabra]
MAHLLQIAVVLGLLVALSATTASARPCRTFVISSYTFSLPSSGDPSLPSTATLTTFTEIRSFRPYPYEIFFDRSGEESLDASKVETNPRLSAPFGFSSEEFSSLRDRTKDILSVVVALLFGVGCGALTAATMYLVWSMFSSRYEYRYEDYLDDDEEDEKIESPKKLGYVQIPAAEANDLAKNAA